MKWSREQFVEVLNNRLPLDTNNSGSDGRKAKKWTERKVRTYFSKDSALPKPIYEGKNVFYTEEHYQALYNLLEIQDMGFTFKSSSCYYSSLQDEVKEESKSKINGASSSLEDVKNSTLSLLNSMGHSTVSLSATSSCSPIYENSNKSSNREISGLSKSILAQRGLTKSKYVPNFDSIKKYKISDDVEISLNGNKSIEDVKQDILNWLNNI